jgi:hypothetical protein
MASAVAFYLKTWVHIYQSQPKRSFCQFPKIESGRLFRDMAFLMKSDRSDQFRIQESRLMM